jgi:nardilysin
MEFLVLAGVQYEPWFEVPYTVEMLSDEILKRWANPEHVDPALRMPIVNAFIPHDFTIRAGRTEIPDPDVPTVLLDEQGLKVWYKLDRTFNTPRANTYFSVTCKAASENIRNIVLTEIYVKLLEHELNETIYLVSFSDIL